MPSAKSPKMGSNDAVSLDKNAETMLCLGKSQTIALWCLIVFGKSNAEMECSKWCPVNMGSATMEPSPRPVLASQFRDCPEYSNNGHFVRFCGNTLN